MKIGQFAKENQMTIDAIRHYMTLDLILPIKQSGQFFFDDKCQKDLESVLELKQMGFSLSEIQSLMLIQRMAKHTHYEREHFFQAFFERRLNWIDEERRRLKVMKKTIEAYLKSRDVVTGSKTVEGIPLEALNVLCCPKCQSSFNIESGELSNNHVVKGDLSCGCGERYTIDSGILMKKEDAKVSEGLNLVEDENLTAHLLTYIQETHYSYLNKIVHMFEWVDKSVEFNYKVALELGTGSGFFLRYFLDKFDPNTLYIAVDHDYERLMNLKSALDSIPKKPKILYLSCDFNEMPICQQSVDFLIDYSGSSNYGFEHKEFLFENTTKYLRPHCFFISSFILFKNFVYGSRIESSLRHQFTEKNVLEALEREHFKIEGMSLTDAITKGGRFEDFFLKGETIYGLTAYGYWK